MTFSKGAKTIRMKNGEENRLRRCRLCGCEDNFNKFFDIFDGDPELKLVKKINKLLPIVVIPWDSLPHTICVECMDKLDFFNDFCETSLKTEALLTNLLSSTPKKETPSPVAQPMETPAVKEEKPVEKKDNPTEEKTEDNNSNTEILIHSRSIPKHFIISPITSRQSIFTCRRCYKTFTKQWWAQRHSCDNTNDCEKVTTTFGTEEDSLPPMKIRLFSERLNQYLCYLCRSGFSNKTDLAQHIKGHFLPTDHCFEGWKECRCEEDNSEEGNSGNEKKLRKSRELKKKKQGRQGEGSDEEWLPNRVKRRNKTSGEPSQGRERPNPELTNINCQYSYSSGKETPESTIQDSGGDDSEPEVIRRDDKPIPVVTLDD